MHIKLLQSRKFISIFLSVSIGKIYTNLAKLDFAINSVGKETNCILSVSKKRLQEEDGILSELAVKVMNHWVLYVYFVTDMLKKACEAKN